MTHDAALDALVDLLADLAADDLLREADADEPEAAPTP
jgi:hypothetical protein